MLNHFINILTNILINCFLIFYSGMMEDVLLGRDEMITFPDFLGAPENFEFLRQPHVVMEKSLGIY